MEFHAPGSLEALRQRNREAVVAALRASGRASRADVARRTGLSRSTVSTVVADLIRQDIVRELSLTPDGNAGSGRPGTPLSLNPRAGVVLALDLTQATLAGAIYNLGHERLAFRTQPLDTRLTSLADIVAHVDALVAELLAEAEIGREAVIGAAMGVPAPIEERSREVGQQSGIPAIVGPRLERELAARLGVPFILENDANLNALAEWTAGAALGHSDAIYLEVSEGVGAGLIVNGRLHRGARGTAGEIGHTPVVPDGPVCRCGNRGCLELVAGANAITEAVSEQLQVAVDIDAVVSRASSGDAMCRRILRDAGSHIGTVVGSVCNLMNPTVIVVGGMLASGWTLIEPALREALDRSAIDTAIQDLSLVPCMRSGTMGRLIGGMTLILMDLERFPVPRAA